MRCTLALTYLSSHCCWDGTCRVHGAHCSDMLWQTLSPHTTPPEQPSLLLGKHTARRHCQCSHCYCTSSNLHPRRVQVFQFQAVKGKSTWLFLFLIMFFKGLILQLFKTKFGEPWCVFQMSSNELSLNGYTVTLVYHSDGHCWGPRFWHLVVLVIFRILCLIIHMMDHCKRQEA